MKVNYSDVTLTNTHYHAVYGAVVDVSEPPVYPSHQVGRKIVNYILGKVGSRKTFKKNIRKRLITFLTQN